MSNVTNTEYNFIVCEMEEYKCQKCIIEKPQVFFGSTNGVMNGICKKCDVIHKPLRKYGHISVKTRPNNW